MRLLVAEYACSGADADLPPSIVREGRAMLRAIVDDLRRVDDVHVVVLLGADLAADWDGPRAEVVPALGGTFAARLRSALADVVAAFVVAPEFDDLLATAAAVVAESGRRWIGCSPEAIALCGDKWRTFGHLREAGVPTVPTVLGTTDPPWGPPWVVKPRLGAGSVELRVVDDPAELPRDESFVVQPLVRGEARSVGVVVDPAGHGEILPVAEQRFAPGGTFQYVGGRVPVSDVGITALVERALESFPGLGGYAGIDVFVPEDGPSLVVEVNPRLTTAYLGYRRLAIDNLAARMIAPPSGSIRWHDGPVTFDPTDA